MTVTLDEIDGAQAKGLTKEPGDFYRDKHKTPSVSEADGSVVKSGKRKGQPKLTKYSRPSGYHHQIEDGYNLTKWDQRNIVLGLAGAFQAQAERPELGAHHLIDQLVVLARGDRDDKAWREKADTLIGAAKQAAKAELAADRGTHTHAILEDDDGGASWLRRLEAGEDLGIGAGVQGALVGAWRRLLAESGIEILAAECKVVNDHYRCAGSLDRIGRLTRPLHFAVAGELVELPAGLVVVVDIKSGAMRLDERDGSILWWHGYAVQCAIYAGSVPYDCDTEMRGEWPWPVDQRWALIAHVPVTAAMDGRDEAQLVLVDLERGRAAAELCKAAKAWEQSRDVFGRAHKSAGAATPAPPADVETPAPPQGPPSSAAPATLVERAARLRTIDGASAWLAARWPLDVPKVPLTELVDPGHVTAIAALFDAADAHFSTPFDPTLDATRITPAPTGRFGLPAAPVRVEWQRPDDGDVLDDATLDALRRTIGRYPPDLKATVQSWTAQARAEGRPIAVDGIYTVRSLEIVRAMQNAAYVWRQTWRCDDELLRCTLAAALGDDGALAPACTVGAAFASLTIDQARQLTLALEACADKPDATPLVFGDDGVPRLAA